jgi:hypothetical protein
MNHDRPTTAAARKSIVLFAFISLVSFLLGGSLLFLMVWRVEKIVALGLAGNLYYIILVPLGLSVSGFLFGVLQSHASYRGEHRGRWTLRGPIVGFVLTVIFGRILVPPPSTFSLTVYVHGSSGKQDTVLKNAGEVWIDLGVERKRAGIGDAGQAYFPAVPSDFHGQEVPISVKSDNFESTLPKIKLDGSSIYLPVRRKAGRIYGHVESLEPGCLSAVQVVVAGVSTQVDSLGHFDLTVPADRLQDELILNAFAHGCSSDTYKVLPDSHAITISMHKISPDGTAAPAKRTSAGKSANCEKTNQVSLGPGSPNVKCVQGDVRITVDQSSGKEIQKP